MYHEISGKYPRHEELLRKYKEQEERLEKAKQYRRENPRWFEKKPAYDAIRHTNKKF